MNYLSVCSGIEAATVAWHPLGWQPAAFSEIEAFPSSVLKHHYPDVPNVGDMTLYKEWNLGKSIDLLVGGTPCQSFSVAGLRKGLTDPRGNLALVYLGIADHFRPRWIVWENVPGVLSSNGGRDFGSFLGALAELGYGFAYRVLDAQFCGVAQRRRRVFVVGYLGDWRPAAAVLFEQQSLRRDTAPRRKPGQEVAGTFTSRARSGGWSSDVDLAAGNYMQPVAKTLLSGGNANNPLDESLICMAHGQAGAEIRTDGGAPTLTCVHEAPIAAYNINFCDTGGSRPDRRDGGLYVTETEVSAALTRAEGTTKIIQPLAFQSKASAHQSMNPSDIVPTLDKSKAEGTAVMLSVTAAFKGGQGSSAGNIGYSEHVAPTLSAGDSGTNRTPALLTAMAVRRLTPVECERLQGFPDNYTNIPWRKQPTAPDGPRYKALGNSMAVPVMAWIGERIAMVDAMQNANDNNLVANDNRPAADEAVA